MHRSLYLISKWPAVFTSIAATFVLATTGVLPTVRAEPPDGYYAAAIGESGAALKDALHVIIDGHTPLNRPQFAGGSKVSMDGAYGKK